MAMVMVIAMAMILIQTSKGQKQEPRYRSSCWQLYFE